MTMRRGPPEEEPSGNSRTHANTRGSGSGHWEVRRGRRRCRLRGILPVDDLLERIGDIARICPRDWATPCTSRPSINRSDKIAKNFTRSFGVSGSGFLGRNLGHSLMPKRRVRSYSLVARLAGARIHHAHRELHVADQVRTSALNLSILSPPTARHVHVLLCSAELPGGGSRRALERHDVRARAQPVEIVRPCLHHRASVCEPLRFVVRAAHFVAFCMSQLQFDNIRVPTLLIEAGRSHRTEAVPGHFVAGESEASK